MLFSLSRNNFRRGAVKKNYISLFKSLLLYRFFIFTINVWSVINFSRNNMKNIKFYEAHFIFLLATPYYFQLKFNI